MAWVRRTARRLPRVPSLAYVHIPVPQFMAAWNGGPTLGSKQEDVACPLVETGLFDAARRAPTFVVLVCAANLVV